MGDGFGGVVDDHDVVRCTRVLIVMMVGDLVKMQDRVALVAVLYQKPLRSQRQTLGGNAEEQQGKDQEATHAMSLPEGFGRACAHRYTVMRDSTTIAMRCELTLRVRQPPRRLGLAFVMGCGGEWHHSQLVGSRGNVFHSDA